MDVVFLLLLHHVTQTAAAGCFNLNFIQSKPTVVTRLIFNLAFRSVELFQEIHMARPSRALTVEEVYKESNVSDSFEALLHS